MANLIPIKGGGGTASDELTATKDKVLSGYTAVTSDSDDEAITGTMPNLSADSTVSCSSDLPNLKVVTNSKGPWIYTNTDGTSRMVIQYRGDSGYFPSDTMIGVAATALGTTAADKVLSGFRFSSSAGINISGTMPNNSTTTSNGTVPGISSSWSAIPTREGTSLQLQTDTDGTKRISICPPQGYYPGPSNGGSYVNRPASDFGTATQDKVLSGSTFTSEAGVKVSGTIASLAGSTITPSSSKQTVSCSGKYMTGNIVINAVPSTYLAPGTWSAFNYGAFPISNLGFAPYHYTVPDVTTPVSKVTSQAIGSYTDDGLAIGYTYAFGNGLYFNKLFPIKKIKSYSYTIRAGLPSSTATGYHVMVQIIFSYKNTDGTYTCYKCLRIIYESTTRLTDYSGTITPDFSSCPYDELAVGFYILGKRTKAYLRSFSFTF